MTRKQIKALKRHKAIVKARNIRTNNWKCNPVSYAISRNHSYHLHTT